MDEQAIQTFWNSHPCGDSMVGGLNQAYKGDYEDFFAAYDKFRYDLEPHILQCLDRLDIKGKQVLEIGTGEGSEAEQLIRRGAEYSAIDLTAEAIERTTTRLKLRGLPFDRIEQASATSIPWPDNSLDVVFSHGVLHHIPDIAAVQREIHRVLRPGGELVGMVYARWSLNYLLAIAGVRRTAVLALYPWRKRVPEGIVSEHLDNAEEQGLREYLKMQTFVHANTDGPGNPFSRVYGVRELKDHFPDFELVETWREFMHAPPLPVHGLPGGRYAGWHLWFRMRPR